MKFIESPQNPQFRQFMELQSSRGIKKHGMCLVYGRKILEEWLRFDGVECECLLGIKQMDWGFAENAIPVIELSVDLFQLLDELGTNAPIGVFKVPATETVDLKNDYVMGLEVLIAAGDPSNLGALIRSACAMGVEKIVLLEEAAHPFHPKTIRASAGAVLSAPLFKGPSIQEVPSKECVALDMHGTSILEYRWSKKIRMLIGEEGPGVPEHLKENSVSIPLANGVESLNAGVAGAIAMYSFLSQFSKK